MKVRNQRWQVQTNGIVSHCLGSVRNEKYSIGYRVCFQGAPLWQHPKESPPRSES